jgi:peptidoglycan/LPS O-acetylase OafA/YrhL
VEHQCRGISLRRIHHLRFALASFFKAQIAPITLLLILAVTLFAYWSLQLPIGWTETEYHNSWLIYTSPYGRLFDFFFGWLAYYVYARLADKKVAFLGYVGVVIIIAAAAVWLHEKNSQLLQPYDLGIALGIFCILASASTESIVNRILTSRFLVGTGVISYSLYLFHDFAGGIVMTGTLPFVQDTGIVAFSAHFAIMLGSAYIIATGLYHAVERPGRRLIRGWSDRLLAFAEERTAGATPRLEASKAPIPVDRTI